MTHVDLFSGIGGFSLAAQACGLRTVQFVEIEERCRDFLNKVHPGVPIHDDIRTFRWPDDADRPFLGTAGVPCQPASRAGKQGGSEDDRWLWPETIRVLLDEARPAWVILENPDGIGDVAEFGAQPPMAADGQAVGSPGDVFTREGRRHLDAILAEIDARGYRVPRRYDGTPIILCIPACAVNAPHRRSRYWIVAHAAEAGCEANGPSRSEQRGNDMQYRQGDVAHAEVEPERPGLCEAQQGRERRGRSSDTGERDCGMADSDTERQQVGRAEGDSGVCERRGEQAPYALQDSGASFWSDFVWLPCADGKLRRAPGDSVGLVDGLHRSVLAALGNSIVPQVAEKVISAIVAAERESTP